MSIDEKKHRHLYEALRTSHRRARPFLERVKDHQDAPGIEGLVWRARAPEPDGADDLVDHLNSAAPLSRKDREWLAWLVQVLRNDIAKLKAPPERGRPHWPKNAKLLADIKTGICGNVRRRELDWLKTHGGQRFTDKAQRKRYFKREVEIAVSVCPEFADLLKGYEGPPPSIKDKPSQRRTKITKQKS
ncbi:MAG: hypothetical protein AB7O60_03625 [Variibacter sp.]